jgi:aminopeptidase
MSTEAFEDLYFKRLHHDYRRCPRHGPLHRRMTETDRVHIKSPGTDLTFSIKGLARKMSKGPQHPRWRSFFLPREDVDQRSHSV